MKGLPANTGIGQQLFGLVRADSQDERAFLGDRPGQAQKQRDRARNDPLEQIPVFTMSLPIGWPVSCKNTIITPLMARGKEREPTGRGPGQASDADFSIAWSGRSDDTEAADLPV